MISSLPLAKKRTQVRTADDRDEFRPDGSERQRQEAEDEDEDDERGSGRSKAPGEGARSCAAKAGQSDDQADREVVAEVA